MFTNEAGFCGEVHATYDQIPKNVRTLKSLLYKCISDFRCNIYLAKGLPGSFRGMSINEGIARPNMLAIENRHFFFEMDISVASKTEIMLAFSQPRR